jgi:hypothetical protein
VEAKDWLNSSSSSVLLINETTENIFTLDLAGEYKFNHSSIDMYSNATLIVVGIPENISTVINTTEFANDSALTIFLNKKSIDFLYNYVSSKMPEDNQTVQSMFLQVTYLDCEKVSGFVAALKCFVIAYSVFSLGFILHALLFIKNRVKKVQLAFV